MKKRNDDLKQYEMELATKSMILSTMCYTAGYVVGKIISKTESNKKKLFLVGSYLTTASAAGLVLKNSVDKKYIVKRVK